MSRPPTSIVARQAPPSLTSMETVAMGISAWAPPYQSAKRSGSVHSFHTRSRGASNTRVIVIPSPPVESGVRGSAMLGSLLLRSQACVEAVEAAFPESTVLLEPVDDLAERRRLEPRGPKLRRPTARDQSRALEHLEVLRDRLNGDRERL